MKAHLMPPFEILNYMFTISKDSPSGLIWKNSNSPSIKPGHIAGSLCKDNYWQVKITHNKLRLSYQVHRIIYYLHTKINPDQLLIDHVNDKQNIIENLRLATHTENTQYQKLRVNNTSKYKGVYCINKNKKRWRAVIQVNKKRIHLGIFETALEAAKAYNEAAILHHKKYALLNTF
jgi:hypothetical protein